MQGNSLKGNGIDSYSDFAWSSGKGQIISKWFLVPLISSKKRTKEFDFTTMIPLVDLFLFVFWRKSKTPKNISFH